ncbi:MAG: GPW/gp25 family protein [Pirellula sp.]|jgi:type VI secretion system protein ImpF|nr:GPW/gp25 family protein [Pirellula sp.]
MASKRNTQQPQVQVSLLDRLSECPVSSIAESTLQRGEHPELDLEEGIKRDLEYLLNSTSYSSVKDLSPWKYVEKSIFNFGVHVAAGKLLTNADAPQIEKAVRLAICRFEPRIRQDTLAVRAYTEEINPYRLSITITIEGQYVGAGEWRSLSMRLSMDSETGMIQPTNAKAV